MELQPYKEALDLRIKFYLVGFLASGILSGVSQFINLNPAYTALQTEMMYTTVAVSFGLLTMLEYILNLNEVVE